MENYYSLRHLRINAYAFPKKQALNIISKFLKNNALAVTVKMQTKGHLAQLL